MKVSSRPTDRPPTISARNSPERVMPESRLDCLTFSSFDSSAMNCRLNSMMVSSKKSGRKKTTIS